MPVRGLDHIAITVVDVEATIAFYERVLGAELMYADLWRDGKLPVAVMQVGTSRMNVHDAAKPALPNARVVTPGAGDVCFRWDGPIEDAKYVFPAVAMVNTALSQLVIERGARPDKEHPRFRIG